MKLTKLIKKDLKLFRRDTKTLVLTIIAPIIILFILGNVFGQSTDTKSLAGLKLGLCDLDVEENNISIPLFQIQDLGKNCEKETKNLVSTGELRAALLIPKDFSSNIREGQGTEITLYVDNSKTQTAIIASESVKALVQNLNEKIGTEFIQNAWDRLKNLNKKLKLVVSKLSIAKEQTINLQNKVNNIQSNLSEVNITQLEIAVEEINQTILNITQSEINISSNINQEIIELREFYIVNCPGTLTPEQCFTIESTINELNATSTQITERERNLNSRLGSLNLSIINEQLELVKTAGDNITVELAKQNETLFNYTNQLIEIIDELEETTQLLDTYTSKDPRNIVRAVALNEEKVFGEKTYFTFLAPGLILVLLLFTIILVSSSNIVYERKAGTLARTLLSPTSIPTFLIGKTIFFMIVAIIEIAVMILTVKLFGINIPLNLSILLMFLVSAISFTFIGLILGSVSNTENSALLSSLVIALPMFFLSNLFFPFEIMPKFMRVIGSNLPLTLSVEGLDKLITYSTSLDVSGLIKLVIIAIILGILTYIAIKRKPTSE